MAHPGRRRADRDFDSDAVWAFAINGFLFQPSHVCRHLHQYLYWSVNGDLRRCELAICPGARAWVEAGGRSVSSGPRRQSIAGTESGIGTWGRLAFVPNAALCGLAFWLLFAFSAA